MTDRAKTILIGLGNPVLGDDGVGWRVAATVADLRAQDQTGFSPTATSGLQALEVDCLAVGGLRLMERLVDYQRAILVDAIRTGRQPAGSVQVFPLSHLPNVAAGHLASAHDATLHTALEMGRSMGASLPEEIIVVAIEAVEVFEFSESLSPPVEAAVSKAVEAVLKLL